MRSSGRQETRLLLVFVVDVGDEAVLELLDHRVDLLRVVADVLVSYNLEHVVLDHRPRELPIPCRPRRVWRRESHTEPFRWCCTSCTSTGRGTSIDCARIGFLQSGRLSDSRRWSWGWTHASRNEDTRHRWFSWLLALPQQWLPTDSIQHCKAYSKPCKVLLLVVVKGVGAVPAQSVQEGINPDPSVLEDAVDSNLAREVGSAEQELQRPLSRHLLRVKDLCVTGASIVAMTDGRHVVLHQMTREVLNEGHLPRPHKREKDTHTWSIWHPNTPLGRGFSL